MALNTSELRSIGQVGAGSGIWAYQCADTDNPGAANYFNNVADTLQVGDRINATLFTNLNKSTQAYAGHSTLVVSNIASGVVSTVAEPSISVTLSSQYTYTTALAASTGTSVGASINTQLAALHAAGGGIAYLPPGFYATSVAILVPSSVQLVGAGAGVSAIVVKAGATTSTIGAGFMALNGSVNAAVRDLTLDLTYMTGSGGNGLIVTNDTTTTGSHWMNYITYSGGGTFTEGETIAGGTSGAAATVAAVNGTTGLSLVNITGTFTAGETVTGRLSGASGTSIAAMINRGAKNVRISGVEVIGKSNQNLQYLVWIKEAENVIVEDCTVDGRTVTETGATEFRLDSNSNMDQQGIEVVGSFQVRVRNNVVRNVTLSGILLTSAETASNHNDTILVEGNHIHNCGNGIYFYSWCSSATVGTKTKNATIRGNTIEVCHKYGVRVGTFGDFAYTLFENVTVADNAVDLRGSKRDTTNYGNFPLRIFELTSNVNTGCKIIGNVFRGGGGKGASTTIDTPCKVQDAHGWEIISNTFDNIGDTATVAANGAAVGIQSSNDIVFKGNTITYPVRLSLRVSAALRCSITNNVFRQNITATVNGRTFSDVSMIEITNTSSNATFSYNVIDSNGSANPSVLGNNSGTGFDYVGNTYVGSTKAFYDTIYPYVAETGTTQTHGFGSYSPADGGASFTITNPKIWKSSRIAIRQTAGTPIAFRVSVADGSFVLTPASVFAGTSTYQWAILN